MQPLKACWLTCLQQRPASPALRCKAVHTSPRHAVLPELPFVHVTVHKAVIAFAILAQTLVAALQDPTAPRTHSVAGADVSLDFGILQISVSHLCPYENLFIISN
jgi:hypothetical protein